MANKITSGPFFVPLFIDGTSNLPVDRLLIGLKNPTTWEMNEPTTQ
ncbi:hypothetical protein ACFWMS_14795 [Peribacillus butanolivorans]